MEVRFKNNSRSELILEQTLTEETVGWTTFGFGARRFGVRGQATHLYPKKHVLDIQTRRTSRYRAWLRALGVNQSGVRDRRNPENQANRED